MTAIAVSSTLRPVRAFALRRTWRGLSLQSGMQSPSLDSKTLIQETDPRDCRTLVFRPVPVYVSTGNEILVGHC
jgi:hypothetical protein